MHLNFTKVVSRKGRNAAFSPKVFLIFTVSELQKWCQNHFVFHENDRKVLGLLFFVYNFFLCERIFVISQFQFVCCVVCTDSTMFFYPIHVRKFSAWVDRSCHTESNLLLDPTETSQNTLAMIYFVPIHIRIHKMHIKIHFFHV